MEQLIRSERNERVKFFSNFSRPKSFIFEIIPILKILGYQKKKVENYGSLKAVLSTSFQVATKAKRGQEQQQREYT